MLKFGISLILIGMLGYAAWLYSDMVPWWSVVVAGAIVGVVVPQKPVMAWLAGFVSIAGLWLWLIAKMDSANEGILTIKMTGLIPVGGSAYVLIALCCLVGGIAAGFGTLTGSFLVRPKKAVSQ